MDPLTVLRSKAINGWPLFWLTSVSISVVMLVAISDIDLTSAAGISEMIAFSVRCSVPFIYLVVAASALQVLFPGAIATWLLRNRKYIGLCFAVAMAWQGLFIFIMSNFHRDYYFDEIYLLRDELEGSTGYIFLAAMVVTSFRFGRRFLSASQWKLLHRSGIYFLWAYPFSVYWWNLFYYMNATPIDYVFYWGGFLAFASRIAAWGKKRLQEINNDVSSDLTPLPIKVLGGALAACGLLVAAIGGHWQKQVTAFLTGPEWSANLELWLPFWPFEPFMSLFVLGLGTLLMTTRVPGQYRAGGVADRCAGS
jgi:hypothetical protein